MHPPQNVWTAGTSENQSQTQSIANGMSSEPMSATAGGEMRRVDALIASIRGAMSLAESLAWVVLDVLGHLFVGVEADLVEADSLSLLIGKAQEGTPNADALRLGENGDVVDVEVVLLWPHHDEPDEPAIAGGDMDDLALYQGRVVIEHWSRWLADSLDVGAVGRVDTGPHTRFICC